MNKKVKWGLIAFIACGLVVWGVYSQLPKLNSELAQADKVESGDKAKKNILKSRHRRSVRFLQIVSKCRNTFRI